MPAQTRRIVARLGVVNKLSIRCAAVNFLREALRATRLSIFSAVENARDSIAPASVGGIAPLCGRL
ncbi:MAG: hypothetical protein DMF21_10835 [Verrucomicrobia bacterium]|nr:MAG: hypothetical protein DMF21_10835 [Verrucomicrobiota bacterium]